MVSGHRQRRGSRGAVQSSFAFPNSWRWPMMEARELESFARASHLTRLVRGVPVDKSTEP